MNKYVSSKVSRAVALLNQFSPFGNKLVQSGYVNPEQMQKALSEVRKSKRPLTEVLESLTGQKLPPDMVRQYKKHHLFELKILYGVDSIDPEINPVASMQMKELIESLISIDVCRRYKLVPIEKRETEPPSVVVSMVDPDNLEATDEIKRILRTQGFEMQRIVIAESDYEELLNQYLDEQAKQEEEKAKSKSAVNVDVSQDIENLDLNFQEAQEEFADDLGAVNDAP